jgi:hypothetical protein
MDRVPLMRNAKVKWERQGTDSNDEDSLEQH